MSLIYFRHLRGCKELYYEDAGCTEASSFSARFQTTMYLQRYIQCSFGCIAQPVDSIQASTRENHATRRRSLNVLRLPQPSTTPKTYNTYSTNLFSTSSETIKRSQRRLAKPLVEGRLEMRRDWKGQNRRCAWTTLSKRDILHSSTRYETLTMRYPCSSSLPIFLQPHISRLRRLRYASDCASNSNTTLLLHILSRNLSYQ